MIARPWLVTLMCVLVLSVLEYGICSPERETSPATLSDKATVYLYRTQRIGTRVLPLILLDGQEVALFVPHRYIKLEVNPGKIEIATSLNLPDPPFRIEGLEPFFREPRPISAQIGLSVIAGQSYFVRGQVGKEFTIVEVDPVEGAKEIRKLQEVKCDFTFLRNALAAMQETRERGGQLTIERTSLSPLSGERKVVCVDQ